jgi:hypothetical protein
MSSSSYVRAPNAQSDDKPTHRRFFIGPMPEKVVSQTEAQVRQKKKRGLFHHASTTTLPNGGEEDHDSLSAVIQEHAFQFFLSQGGNEEDWGQNEEGVRQEMLRRWRDSEWGSILKRRNQKTHDTSRWVGGSFEIGTFLGVTVLNEAHTGGSRHSTSSKGPGSYIKPGSSITPNLLTKSSTVPTQIAVERSTAPPATFTEPSNIPEVVQLSSVASTSGPSPLLSPENGHDADLHRPISDLPTTPSLIPDSDQALPSKVRLSALKRPPLATIPAKSVNRVSTSTSRPTPLDSQKSKTVRYTDSADVPSPAPPTEVLARTGSAVQETSAGAAEATEATVTQDGMDWGDVVMRGCPHPSFSLTRV